MNEPQPTNGLDLTVPDDRILASAAELRASGKVTIATGDTTMRLKADSLGFNVVAIPEVYLIREDEAPKSKGTLHAPKLKAALVDDQGNPANHRSILLGLSAKQLIPVAEKGLTAARMLEHGHFGGLIGSILVDEAREPSATSWQRFLDELREYDNRYSKTFMLVLGVLNDGTASADDVVAEFCFPANLRVSKNKPTLPSPPRRRSTLDDLPQLVTRPRTVGEPNETLSIKRDGETGTAARITAHRVLQTQLTSWPVWVEVLDATIGGFAIEVRLLAGTPPLTIQQTLNIRIRK